MSEVPPTPNCRHRQAVVRAGEMIDRMISDKKKGLKKTGMIGPNSHKNYENPDRGEKVGSMA